MPHYMFCKTSHIEPFKTEFTFYLVTPPSPSYFVPYPALLFPSSLHSDVSLCVTVVEITYNLGFTFLSVPLAPADGAKTATLI